MRWNFRIPTDDESLQGGGSFGENKPEYITWLYGAAIAVVLLALFLIPLVLFARRQSDASEATAAPWKIENFKTLVTFGDSYTDEGRKRRWNENHPPGWRPPVTNETDIGGYVWPRYVGWLTNADIYNYALGGACCSWNNTPGASTTVVETQIPLFEADLATSVDGRPFMNNDKNTTVYSSWIGTNDFGPSSYLTDNQKPGSTLEDFAESVFRAFDGIYAAGARKMVLMNLIPLNLLPLYALPERGGLQWSRFWPEKANKNATEISLKMENMVLVTNEHFKEIANAAMKDGKRYPGARLALYDTWSLFKDIYENPSKFLNGTDPVNVTSSIVQTFEDGKVITSSSPDSYEWYDDLHLSEQTGRHVAKEFVEVVSGTSKYATYWP